MKQLFSTSRSDDEKLTYQEELTLGDQCVARRAITDLLEEEEREPTEEEAKVIETGDRAASRLVEKYTPFIARLANTEFQKSPHSDGSLAAVDDLINVGVLHALLRTRSFNPRGAMEYDGSGRPGVRFATYIRRDASKAMRIALQHGAMVMKVDRPRIANTAIWNATREELKVTLRRTPTDAEISEVTGFGRDKIFSENYIRPRFEQAEEVTIAADSSSMTMKSLGDNVHLSHDNTQAALRFILAVAPHFTLSNTQLMVEMFGIMDGNPKERDAMGRLTETYPDIFPKAFIAQRWFKSVSARLTHPQFMARIARSLQATDRTHN